MFNGGLYQRDNVLESHSLNYVSGSNKKGYTPSGEKLASLVRHMYPAVKTHESV